MYNIFPYLGFLLRANKTLLKNRDEFHAYVKVTFLENLKTLDKNDQRSFIDAFLVKQQEVTGSFFIKLSCLCEVLHNFLWVLITIACFLWQFSFSQHGWRISGYEWVFHSEWMNISFCCSSDPFQSAKISFFKLFSRLVGYIYQGYTFPHALF